MDGPIALTECTVDAGFDCEIEALCPTRTNWRKINEAVIAALNGISLADMAPQKAPRMSYKFQIKEFVEKLIWLNLHKPKTLFGSYSKRV